jgi:hypothetical protein
MLLVDAHNLLHRDPRLGAVMRRDAEAARRALERLLGPREDLILFYDGGPGGRADSRRRGGVRVDFSGRGEADERILAWLRDHPGGRHVVVTDDRALAARARALGAGVAPTAGLVVHAPPTAPAKPEPSADEVAYWLRVFGD